MGYIDGTSAIEMLDNVFEVLEGGKSVTASNVSEMIADNGAKICDITKYTTTAGNGASAEVAEVVNISAGATAGTTTGAGILAMDVGLAGVGVAVALGVAGGFALYNLAPEFWTEVSNQLVEAGCTVKGKVIGFIDKNGNTSLPENALNIFKNALVNAGVFSDSIFNYGTAQLTQSPISSYNFPWKSTYFAGEDFVYTGGSIGNYTRPIIRSSESDVYCFNFRYIYNEEVNIMMYAVSDAPFTAYRHPDSSPQSWENAYSFLYNNKYMYHLSFFSAKMSYIVESNFTTLIDLYAPIVPSEYDMWELLFNGGLISKITPLQPDATYPEPGIDIPQTYPDWMPAEFPQPLPAEMPDNYPLSLPDPDATQDPAQTGENANPEQQDRLLEIFYNALPDPNPHILPDPDASAEIEPEPAPNPQPEPNPSDPNPEPPTSDPTIVLPTLETLSASRMFTVYNPTDAQVNGLGAFLWNSNIIEQIKKLWENPMDGIISFHKIYGAPVTGTSKHIILGYIDSEVSALEVTSQFCEIDCGTVHVPERLHNATDYAPFTSLHCYLPFVGTVELDTNECMNADLHIKYRIDVYTGTCVALLYLKRDVDIPQEQIIYTFSGNASQKLPLTASDFSGAIGALLGLAGAGVAVASGGALGAVAGAVSVAHSLTSEMVHIQHSGGLSANAGILSPRVPYLILSRQYGYDANGYNGFYGYPANKTVYIGNCNGYIKCKDVIFRGSCTEEEANEIVSLLKSGVYT